MITKLWDSFANLLINVVLLLMGTLTSWRLLAEGVNAEQGGSGACNADSPHDGACSQSKCDDTLLQRYSLRSPSFWRGRNRTTLDTGAAPKPLHLLYREYRLLNDIGAGAFGRVCRARRLVDGVDVVVKEVRTVALSQKLRLAMLDEVSVLASLSHPNVVQYIDAFIDDMYINTVMEFCSAGDLGQLLKARAGVLLSEGTAMFLFVQICLAIHYVHAAGITHRDLKAGNCMLFDGAASWHAGHNDVTAAAAAAAAGCAVGISVCAADYAGLPLLKLGDFGVAKVIGPNGMSGADTIVGTPQYLAPEMVNGRPPYGRRTDIWALGCCLYELLTLRKAFDSDKLPALFARIAAASYEPLPPTTPPPLVSLVDCMLRAAPEERPTASELLNLPYVRRHLAAYLAWARCIPHAKLQTVLHSLGPSLGCGLSAAHSVKTDNKIAAAPVNNSNVTASSTAAATASVSSGRQLPICVVGHPAGMLQRPDDEFLVVMGSSHHSSLPGDGTIGTACGVMSYQHRTHDTATASLTSSADTSSTEPETAASASLFHLASSSVARAQWPITTGEQAATAMADRISSDGIFLSLRCSSSSSSNSDNHVPDWLARVSIGHPAVTAAAAARSVLTSPASGSTRTTSGADACPAVMAATTAACVDAPFAASAGSCGVLAKVHLVSCQAHVHSPVSHDDDRHAPVSDGSDKLLGASNDPGDVAVYGGTGGIGGTGGYSGAGWGGPILATATHSQQTSVAGAAAAAAGSEVLPPSRIQLLRQEQQEMQRRLQQLRIRLAVGCRGNSH